MLTTSERGYNAGPPASEVADLVSIFERQVEGNPDGIALKDGAAIVSYARLNQAVNRLARRLLEMRATGGGPLGICLDRSVDFVVGTLAILKIGAWYVPIDCEYPLERIRNILEEARAPFTLTRRSLARGIPPEFTTPIFLEDHDYDSGDDSNPGIGIDPCSPCHLTFTSGTTGKPKGIEVPHAGICRLLRSTNYLHLDSGDVVLHHSTSSFDAGTFELWAALLNGGTLVLYPRQTIDFDSLTEAITRFGVTTLLLTTSIFHLVVEHKPEVLRTLRHLVVGGDAMQAKAARKAITLFPHLQLVNGYGPAENCVFTCCHLISCLEDVGDHVPIGMPITGTNVFILDQKLQPVADGEVGELYTNGLGMAKGYLRRESLTRERFLPCPFAETGPIMYKTGDLVRRAPNGPIYFVGRADNQVKIRGFRVEPAEVEAAIHVRPDVEDCIVLANTDAAGEKYLTAYVKPVSRGLRASAAEIRHDVASRLPVYMVPAFIEIVLDLPLTPNGKIDRTRVRAERRGNSLPDSTEPPVSRVLRAWREQLLTPSLGPDDSLYDFGASSLSVIVVHSKLNEAYSCVADANKLAMAQTPREWSAIYETAANRGESGAIADESNKE